MASPHKKQSVPNQDVETKGKPCVSVPLSSKQNSSVGMSLPDESPKGTQSSLKAAKVSPLAGRTAAVSSSSSVPRGELGRRSVGSSRPEAKVPAGQLSPISSDASLSVSRSSLPTLTFEELPVVHPISEHRPPKLSPSTAKQRLRRAWARGEVATEKSRNKTTASGLEVKSDSFNSESEPEGWPKAAAAGRKSLEYYALCFFYRPEEFVNWHAGRLSAISQSSLAAAVPHQTIASRMARHDRRIQDYIKARLVETTLYDKLSSETSYETIRAELENGGVKWADKIFSWDNEGSSDSRDGVFRSSDTPVPVRVHHENATGQSEGSPFPVIQVLHWLLVTVFQPSYNSVVLLLQQFLWVLKQISRPITCLVHIAVLLARFFWKIWIFRQFCYMILSILVFRAAVIAAAYWISSDGMQTSEDPGSSPIMLYSSAVAWTSRVSEIMSKLIYSLISWSMLFSTLIPHGIEFSLHAFTNSSTQATPATLNASTLATIPTNGSLSHLMYQMNNISELAVTFIPINHALYFVYDNLDTAGAAARTSNLEQREDLASGYDEVAVNVKAARGHLSEFEVEANAWLFSARLSLPMMLNKVNRLHREFEPSTQSSSSVELYLFGNIKRNTENKLLRDTVNEYFIIISVIKNALDCLTEPMNRAIQALDNTKSGLRKVNDIRLLNTNSINSNLKEISAVTLSTTTSSIFYVFPVVKTLRFTNKDYYKLRALNENIKSLKNLEIQHRLAWDTLLAVKLHLEEVAKLLDEMKRNLKIFQDSLMLRSQSPEGGNADNSQRLEDRALAEILHVEIESLRKFVEVVNTMSQSRGSKRDFEEKRWRNRLRDCLVIFRRNFLNGNGKASYEDCVYADGFGTEHDTARHTTVSVTLFSNPTSSSTLSHTTGPITPTPAQSGTGQGHQD